MQGGDLRAASVIMASRFQVDMATLAQRLMDLGLVDGDDAAAIRTARTTQSDMIEPDLHVPPEEFVGETQPRAYQQGVLTLVRRRSISREKALSLLPSSFELDDLPPPLNCDPSTSSGTSCHERRATRRRIRHRPAPTFHPARTARSAEVSDP